jgi:hydroxyacylglutathione hydrolase
MYFRCILGRFFEGSADELYLAESRLARLPGHTRLYCGHEYTVANLKFAALVEPENDAVTKKLAWALAQRACGRFVMIVFVGMHFWGNFV